jgi:hypothetical protein
MATWPGRQLAPWFRDPEITAEDPAVAEHLGNPGCPKFPRKPDVPRKWDQRDWCAAWDRIVSAACARRADPAQLIRRAACGNAFDRCYSTGSVVTVDGGFSAAVAPGLQRVLQAAGCACGLVTWLAAGQVPGAAESGASGRWVRRGRCEEP